MTIKKELKVKAKILDPTRMEKKVKRIAKYICKESVTDYFLSNEMNISRELRLRKSENGKEATFKVPISINEFQENEEYKFKVDNENDFINFLELTGFKIVASLKKQTKVYDTDGISIRLSNIETVGDYIELEVECYEEFEEQKKEQIRNTIRSLEILDSEIDNRYYSIIKQEHDNKQ